MVKIKYDLNKNEESVLYSAMGSASKRQPTDRDLILSIQPVYEKKRPEPKKEPRTVSLADNGTFSI